MISFFKKSHKFFFAVEHTNILQKSDINKLKWLFDNSELIKSKTIKGNFIGPIKEMITPWSTNAVEIAENIEIKSITRIEKLIKKEDESIIDPMLEQIYNNPNQKIFYIERKAEKILEVKDLKKYNEKEGLALNEEEIKYLENVSKKIKRKLTDSEVFGFSQVNSEHCRHKIFNGAFIIDNKKKSDSLFGLIKKTSKENKNEIVSAYKDNVAFVNGPEIELFTTKSKEIADFYKTSKIKSVLSLKAETHNFPTTVEPFSGAATGSGGEIRDRMAGGQASFPLAGTAVYMTSYPRLKKSNPWEKKITERKWLYQSPLDILIKASNGASDYGNKFGQPLICGSVLTFEHEENELSHGYDKVIMMAGGIGFGNKINSIKKKIKKGDCIVVLGGDNYRIGMGGSSVSSVATGEYGNKIELNAVQRANPEMQKRAFNVIRALGEENINPILSIHDHGAGGHLNCLSELLEDSGGVINIKNLPIGDPTLSEKEIIGNESQERMGLIIKKKDLNKVALIAKRERSPFYHVGIATEDNKLIFKGIKGKNPIDLSVDDFFGSSPKTIINDKTIHNNYEAPKYHQTNLIKYLENVLSIESVACKDWLTNKVDRCVTGKVAKQQCAGEIQLPLNNVSVMALDFKSLKGVATSIGHAPVMSLIDEKTGSKIAILKALTNIVWAPLTKKLSGISLSANWMWPCKNSGEDTRLYNAVKAISDFAISLGINIPTGKDSLSMTQKYPDGKSVQSPGTVIISAIGEVNNINSVISPNLKYKLDTELIYIGTSKNLSLAGSAFSQTQGNIGGELPELYNSDYIKTLFNSIQNLINEKKILSGHDISSGGFITSILEMNFSNKNYGMELDLKDFKENDLIKILFNESPGIILQVNSKTANELKRSKLKVIKLGKPIPNRSLTIKHNNSQITLDIDYFRDKWYKTSHLLDNFQTKKEYSKLRFENYKKQPLKYSFPKNFDGIISNLELYNNTKLYKRSIKAAVIREKGINSEREMAYMLHISGFDVKDIHMTDIVNGKENLEDVNMIVFPGGFSNSDVLGSAKGWAGIFKYNATAKSAIENFYNRSDTLSLGVCNGCQLMMELGLIYPNLKKDHPKMKMNKSNKFECTFSAVKILKNSSVMLKNLSNTTLGVWSAHGEGKFYFKNKDYKYNIAGKFLYNEYPGNPNGSDQNAAILYSKDGRHLSMMPHLERSIFPWNWGYYDYNNINHQITPWIKAFINARKWFESKKSNY